MFDRLLSTPLLNSVMKSCQTTRVDCLFGVGLSGDTVTAFSCGTPQPPLSGEARRGESWIHLRSVPFHFRMCVELNDDSTLLVFLSAEFTNNNAIIETPRPGILRLCYAPTVLNLQAAVPGLSPVFLISHPFALSVHSACDYCVHLIGHRSCKWRWSWRKLHSWARASRSSERALFLTLRPFAWLFHLQACGSSRWRATRLMMQKVPFNLVATW